MLSSRSHDEMPDIELVRRYRESGDMDVLGVLFGRYMNLVYGVCLKYLRDREDSKDAVMQVFEKLTQTPYTRSDMVQKLALYHRPKPLPDAAQGQKSPEYRNI
jgi:hypothetical protein